MAQLEDRRRRRARWLAALAAVALIAGACGGGEAGDEAPSGEAAGVEARPQTGDGAGLDPGGDPDGASSEAAADDPEEAPEPLVAPLDTTTTTTAPPDAEGVADAPAEPQPQPGGTLRVGVEAESDGLNPAANNFALAAYIMTYPVFDPLAYVDARGDWIPYLAESFTNLGDGAVWEMRLREGVRFHDGTELDADDVIATLEAQFADPVLSLVYRNAMNIEEFASKVDDYTVEFRLTRPMARLPHSFVAQLGMVLPSEWLVRAAEDPTMNQRPVGTGPFMVASRVQDEVTVLVRNPDYWAADRTDVYLDRIEVYPITDPVVAAERLAAGDLELVITAGADATLVMRETEGVTTIENARLEEGFAVINSQRPPFDDIRARQALTFASDRDAYVALIRQGVSPPADTMFHPDLIWHNPDVKQETNMPERAGPLVAEYCADNPGNCSGGRINMEIHFGGPSVENVRIAELQTDAWSEFFNVTPVEVLQDKLINDVVLGNFNVVNWNQFGGIDPDSEALWLQCSSIAFVSLNFPRYCDPERDELMFESRGSDDLQRRVEIWHRIQEMMRDSYTYIFYYHTNWVIGARDNVRGICGQTSPDGVELWCNRSGRMLLQGLWLS